MRTIWLASYPKSGNTWMRVLLANLALEDDQPADINNLALRGGIASARERFDQVTLIDSGLLTLEESDALRPQVYETLADDPCDDESTPQVDGAVRFIKAHDAYSRTSSGEPLLGGARAAAGAIVIVRDPRDIAPSLAHHSQFSIDEAIAFMDNADACFCGRRDRQHRQLRQRSAEHKAAFLASQFEAQRFHYRKFFPATAFDVIERNGMPVGRLYVDVRVTHIHVIDIALMPEVRGRGVGTALMMALQDYARELCMGLDLFVETFNPALRLYRRLGFVGIADHDIQIEMEWLPQLNKA